jgi:signal peptidase I
MPTRMEMRRQREQNHRKEARLWALELLSVFFLALLVRTFLFSLTTVQGPSMQETLHSGQVVAVDKLYFRFHDFARGLVVICRYPDSNEYYVKRIVGLPGERVEIRDGQTYIGGEPLAEPYVAHPAESDFGPYQVPEGCVFVMGDNRANSHDSRAEGALAKDMIVGRVLAVCFPLGEAHSIQTAAP